MKFATFMASTRGRAIRMIVGVLLVLWGFTLISDGYSILIMVFGAIVFLAGYLNFCLLAPILRLPFWAKDLD